MHFPHVPREILMPETCYLKLCSGAGRCLSTSNFGHPEQGGAGDAKGGAVIVGSLDCLPLWKHADEPGRRCHEREERRCC
jgi:hypothetical protein